MNKNLVIALSLALLATVVVAPTASAAPPQPGGDCDLKTRDVVVGDSDLFGPLVVPQPYLDCTY